LSVKHFRWQSLTKTLISLDKLTHMVLTAKNVKKYTDEIIHLNEIYG